MTLSSSRQLPILLTRRWISTRSRLNKNAQDSLAKDVLDTMSKPVPKTTSSNTPPLPPQSESPKGLWGQIQSDAIRKTRFEQAVVNTVLAFGVMLMSAQNLKLSSEKRSLEEELAKSKRQCQQGQALVQQIFSSSSGTLDNIAQKILQTSTTTTDEARTATNTTSGWTRLFSSASTKPKSSTSTNQSTTSSLRNEQQQYGVRTILQQELFKAIHPMLDPDEQEVLHSKLFPLVDDKSTDTTGSSSTNDPMTKSPVPLEALPEDVQKQVFTM